MDQRLLPCIIVQRNIIKKNPPSKVVEEIIQKREHRHFCVTFSSFRVSNFKIEFSHHGTMIQSMVTDFSNGLLILVKDEEI